MTIHGRQANTVLRQAAARFEEHRQEDRLTAVFAATLQRNEQLVQALMRKCGVRLRSDGLSFDVCPQAAIRHGTRASRTTDIAITALRGSMPVGRLWCEGKLYAPEGRRQLDDQFAALSERTPATGNGRLVAIVLRDEDEETIRAAERQSPTFKIRVITWLDVKDLVNEVGASALGADWLDRPVRPREGIDIAILRAFVRRLEGGNLVSRILNARAFSETSFRAIETDDKLALEPATWFLFHASTSDRVRILATQGAEGKVTRTPDGGSLIRQDLLPNRDTRFVTAGFRPFVAISAAAISGSAALQVGVFARARDLDLDGRDMDSWAARLARIGFDLAGIEPIREEVKIARGVPLREIAARGTSIRVQRAAAADFISRGLRDLAPSTLLSPAGDR